ncbi:PH domain-containing protein [Pseudonocardia spinosispora]|uniref:PH domain-containing protein n=1 Tax=Pseudonocardia spinosispora TaxID=103441 RepID=UPI000408F26D|nr:PH domain-containing protein [Pseudonocardia spinosispora]
MSSADNRYVFRVSPLAVLAAVTLAVCVTPIAVSAVWLLPVYLIPVAVIVYVLRRRTTVDSEAMEVRGIVGSTRVAWSEISGLKLRSSRTRSRVSAVLTSGTELPLPAVYVRDLPVLAEASGGRIPDPSAPKPEPTTPATPASPESPEE